MAKQVTWSGYSKFIKSNVDNVTTKSGIYKLASEDPKDEKNVNVFYVGQTKSLQERLTQHLDDKENDCIKNKITKMTCYFTIAEVSQQDDRDCMESFMYDSHKPECNKQKPTAKPCEINLR